jgi:integrase
VRIALMTGMRTGEVTRLTWRQIDFGRRAITVGRAKSSSGTGRMIPLSAEMFAILSAHADWFTERFGTTQPQHYLFPFGKPSPTDPSRPTTTLKTAWSSLRKAAKVDCRLHNLRHTAATKWRKRACPKAPCSQSWAT